MRYSIERSSGLLTNRVQDIVFLEGKKLAPPDNRSKFHGRNRRLMESSYCEMVLRDMGRGRKKMGLDLQGERNIKDQGKIGKRGRIDYFTRISHETQVE